MRLLPIDFIKPFILAAVHQVSCRAGMILYGTYNAQDQVEIVCVLCGSAGGSSSDRIMYFMREMKEGCKFRGLYQVKATDSMRITFIGRLSHGMSCFRRDFTTSTKCD